MTVDLGSGASPDLAWLAQVLWSGVASARVATRDPSAIERYVVVPSAAKPRLLLPAEPRAAATALSAFNALRPARTRAERAMLAVVMRSGLARTMLRDRLAIGADRGDMLLSRALADILGRERVVLAVNVRPPTPFRKPVVQVLTPQGELLAFAKIGWNEVTKDGVRSEADALAALDGGTDLLATPRLVHRGPWLGHEILVTSPLPASVRRYRAQDGAPSLAVSREVAGLRGTTRSTLAQSAYLGRLHSRIDAVAAAAVRPDIVEALDALLAAIAGRAAASELEFGMWHGDWSPWNLAHAGSRLAAWDWEYASDDVPVGSDAVHFRFQVAFIGRGMPITEAFSFAAQAAPDLLAGGIEEPELVTALHAAEIAVRYLHAMMLGADENARFTAGAVDALRAVAVRLERT